MALSVIRVLSLTTSQIKILFTDDLDSNIGVSNIAVTSNIDSVSDSTVSSVLIEDNVLTVNFRPIFPKVQYTITFSSTDDQSFQTVNGEAIIEDGKRNTLIITSPGETESAIRDDMLEELSLLYETEEQSLVRDLVSDTADQLQKVSDAIKTTRSGNYLSVLVENELKTRGSGPTDTLDNGGAYEVLRVASTSEEVLKTTYITFDAARESSFITNSTVLTNSVIETLPADPISLKSVDVIEEEVSDDVNEENFFSGMTIRVSNGPVIQVISVTLNRNGSLTPYNIDQFGYTLLDNRYDTDAASKNVNLTNRDIVLSASSLTGDADGFLQPIPGDTISVSYVYKKLGRNIDPESVELSTVKDVVRETIPSILTSFFLEHAPIVTSGDIIPTLDGVTFVNADALNGNAPQSTSHPAFLTEIEFDELRVPSNPGEYSIDYETGRVLVFGEDSTAQGTGLTPPVASYSYRKIYTENLDYTFDSDIDELALKSSSNLDGSEGRVSFDYEDIFAVDEDYRVLSHVESLNERIENRLVGNFAVSAENFPITDVFRVFNETTGEIYTIERFNDTTITFSGRKAPAQADITRERVSFSREAQETLFISDELTNSSSLLVYQIDLTHNGITDSNRNFIGANFSTSVSFSDTDIFIQEKFYEDRLYEDVDTNIDRLTSVGEYMIDYVNGIVYVAVTADQDSDLGDISYEYEDILTRNDHILKANDIYRSISVSAGNVETFTVGTVTDTTINILDLNQVGERFLNDDETRPLLVGSYQAGTDGITTENIALFSSNSAIFTEDDIGRTLVVGSSTAPPVEEFVIQGVVNTHQVTVDVGASNTKVNRVWNILDLSEDAEKTITLAHNISSIQNIYSVTQLGSVVASELDGYFDINRDSFEDNVITLGADNPLSVGDAIIVVYNYGNLFVDYRYLKDDLLISYEYGNNSIDWSISNAINEGDEYFVTYRYGALRDALLANFGALTQIPSLTNFPPDFNRETYRSIVGGALQSFVQGPTIPSIKALVKSFTDVEPNITESAFQSWILGRDYLHLRKLELSEDAVFDLGKFDNGLLVDGTQTVQVPALAHFRLNEGTLETWVKPTWDGLDNDADVVFDLYIDEEQDVSTIFIGLSGTNPTTVPFTLNVDDTDINVIGQPTNIDDDFGYFIWFDEFTNQWNIRWRESAREGHVFEGTITTEGEFFNVDEADITLDDNTEEAVSLFTSSFKTITFEAGTECFGPDDLIDGGPFAGATFASIIDGGAFTTTSFTCIIDGGSFLDAYVSSTVTAVLISTGGMVFSAGEEHYLFDMGQRSDTNRVSIFKDGTGYLNFRVIDNSSTQGLSSGLYNLSTNVRDWNAGETHHIATTWKFNSDDEQDFMRLFVDGQEVPNLFKYGGRPEADSNFDYGNVAEETVISSVTRPTVGGFDGSSEAGSALFTSDGVDFESAGVEVGDTFKILDATADGLYDPVTGGSYTITGVGSTTILLNRALTLTLGDIHFSVNQIRSTITTNINFQDFIVVTVDAYGTETELAGVDAEEPDYSASRGDYATHILSVNNGVSIGDTVKVKTLGLVFRRYLNKIFVYNDGDNKMRVNGPPPVSLDDIDITKILINTILVEEGTIFDQVNGSLFASFGGDGYESLFADGYVFRDGYVCQPSNQVVGRKLKVMLNGDNIDYSGSGNRVIIRGDTLSGSTEETLIFTENTSQITDEYWRNIETVDLYVVPVDITAAAGVFEIRERKPINETENYGDFVEISDFANGIFTLLVYGSGGVPYYPEACYYEIDYPSFLKLNVTMVPDTFYIGSDMFGSNQFNGVIDDFKILKTARSDTRVGETLTSDSITADFDATEESETNTDTVFLANFNDDTNDASDYIDAFGMGFEIAPGVNDDFSSALLVAANKPFEVSNAGGAFNNDEGTIEFWVNPLDDSDGDPNLHYYIDLSSTTTEDVTSSTKVIVQLSQRAREIESVRLATDVNREGINYFTGGSLSTSDRITITLGIPLPAPIVDVVVTYVALNSQGDRVSIFKDSSAINFYMKASGVEHLISTPISWDRHTWHRIMVMWTTNSNDNEDRLRMFVDGIERGTVKYGTGLLYGSGIIYGQAEIRPGQNRFVVDNIDLTDVFTKLFVGTDILKANGARALIDNLRFSSIERLDAIDLVGNDYTDVNYTSNTDVAVPVVSDTFTTKLLNFDQELELVEFFATLIDSERGIFKFTVEVIDSFDKVIGNATLEKLLTTLVNTLKPAHTESTIIFSE